MDREIFLNIVPAGQIHKATFDGTNWTLSSEFWPVGNSARTELVLLAPNVIAVFNTTSRELYTLYYDGVKFKKVGNSIVLPVGTARFMHPLDYMTVVLFSNSTDLFEAYKWTGVNWVLLGANGIGVDFTRSDLIPWGPNRFIVYGVMPATVREVRFVDGVFVQHSGPFSGPSGSIFYGIPYLASWNFDSTFFLFSIWSPVDSRLYYVEYSEFGADVFYDDSDPVTATIVRSTGINFDDPDVYGAFVTSAPNALKTFQFDFLASLQVGNTFPLPSQTNASNPVWRYLPFFTSNKKMNLPDIMARKKFGQPWHPDPYNLGGIYQRRMTKRGKKSVKMRYYRPSNPQTVPQENNRQKFKMAMEAWNNLTESEKGEYNRRARGKPLFGVNLFIKQFYQNN